MPDDGCISLTRVLLVEDHQPFRKFIRATLTKQKRLQVIAETGDGLEAVSKCLELQPGLVLMDIGLPGLNGIEAARRIRAFVPTCKIVFLTQEASPEIMHEAFKLGASSYVVKTHASDDLVPAITAALEGRQFVSDAGALREKARAAAQGMAASTASTQLRTGDSHVAHFHADDAALLDEFAGFIEGALAAGRAVISIATRPHRAAIQRLLQTRGVDVAASMVAGRFVPLDVDETLAKFMVNGRLDPDRFFAAAEEVVKSLKAQNPGVRVLASGEISPSLWARGDRAAAIQMEHLWDQLVRIHDLETLCGYMLAASQHKTDAETYDAICAVHSSILSFCH
jgi:DNA-binding NarL/FixJ family response regulator